MTKETSSATPRAESQQRQARWSLLTKLRTRNDTSQTEDHAESRDASPESHFPRARFARRRLRVKRKQTPDRYRVRPLLQAYGRQQVFLCARGKHAPAGRSSQHLQD